MTVYYHKQLGFADYESYLKSDLWKSIKKRVVKKHGSQCKKCDSKYQDIHHEKYTRANISGETIEHLIPLCRSCHELEHGITGVKSFRKRKKSQRRKRRKDVAAVGTNPKLVVQYGLNTGRLWKDVSTSFLINYQYGTYSNRNEKKFASACCDELFFRAGSKPISVVQSGEYEGKTFGELPIQVIVRATNKKTRSKKINDWPFQHGCLIELRRRQTNNTAKPKKVKNKSTGRQYNSKPKQKHKEYTVFKSKQDAEVRMPKPRSSTASGLKQFMSRQVG